MNHFYLSEIEFLIQKSLKFKNISLNYTVIELKIDLEYVYIPKALRVNRTTDSRLSVNDFKIACCSRDSSHSLIIMH